MPHDLYYQVVDGFSHPILSTLESLQFGFTALEKKPGKGSLDYIRGNLFDISTMQIIPDVQQGKENDLNDLFDLYVQKAINEQAVFYAFGARWFPSKPHDTYFKDIPDQGIHDIHMNQGNPNPGDYAKDNGVWQDGALLMHFPQSNKWVAVFLRFQSQAIHTDDTTGHPIAVAPETTVFIHIIAALVNPLGVEEGNEKVILFNSGPLPAELKNWAIANNTKKQDLINITIKSGESVTVKLSKNVPLSNKGGIITLLNDQGIKIDGVSYTKEQAGREGSWILFGSLPYLVGMKI